MADRSDNPRAAVLAKTLDEATGQLLENGRSPQRKVHQLDNRGSHFYLALYWAQALAGQFDDSELADAFKPLAESLASQEGTIVAELDAVQGASVDLGGYYFADREKADAVMRPSETFNAAIAQLGGVGSTYG
jgi:isocitrate dehydrogenase